MPRVGALFLYPIKSLDGIEVEAASLSKRGPFEHDRAWAIVDEAGEVLTGKREAGLQKFRVGFDVERGTMSVAGEEVAPDDPRAGSILTELLGRRVQVVRVDGGAPDHNRAPGPTVIARATLALFAEWFGWSGWEEARRRLRMNVIVDDAPPFWEERLVPPFLRAVEFSLGDARLRGIEPCGRCAVPSRDSLSGVAEAGFQKSFVEKRRATFPEWSVAGAFPHYYHAGVLTRVSRPARISVGDPIEIRGMRIIDRELRLVARASLARLKRLV